VDVGKRLGRCGICSANGGKRRIWLRVDGARMHGAEMSGAD
jgi:hypothetical protein